jgi:hypothetical protein
MRFLSRGFLDMLQELKDIWDKANFLKQCLEFFLQENSLAMSKITPKNKKNASMKVRYVTMCV